MAKRHNHYRGRGGGRRGSSRSHGSSRGRPGGRPFKRRGRPKGNWSDSNQSLGNGDLNNPDLDDVYFGDAIAPEAVEDYYFGNGVRDKSMKMGGFRPGNRDESPSSKLAFRKRPMSFVKAKDVYDPSHDLIKSLRNQNSHLMKTDVLDGDGQEKQSNEYANESHQQVAQDYKSDKNEESDENEASDEGDESDEFDRNDAGDEDEKEEEDLVQDENGQARDHQSDLDQSEETDTHDLEALGDEHLFMTDENGNEPLEVNFVEVDEDQEEGIGPFGDDFTAATDAVYQSGNDGYRREYGVEQKANESPHLSSTLETLNISGTLSETKKEELQCLPFGAAEEDSFVDLSEIAISNVRVGFSDDSYYTKCFRLFGNHDFRWVDRDNLVDFILEELNFPEHRLDAYLKFIKDSIMTPDIPEPSYSDVPLSESDESGEEGYFRREDSVSSDMKEGLDDLIAYTEKYSVVRSQDYETFSLNTTGKGKKKKLLVEESLEMDAATLATLQDKFSCRVQNKAKNRRFKQDFIDEQNKFSEDLYKKYPIGLHVQNIKDECEAFLERKKDRLTFPPLDPHGNNVILKICHNFNLKGYKEGSGKNSHVVAQKTKRTERYLPNYDMVSRLLKQRPVFFRMDVDRPGKNSTERINSSKAKFHTKEGEIVGQDAPEIGKDNIGRKMLEKLGWSNGEGLGAMGNKGIAEPLMAKVKKSKSGLKHE
ncbi:SQS1 (YNL224C) [Zygosaccharomyces parabailii]|nr:SQS1 (YNL224C) [Zygosaccharomyces parabailii]CDH08238.1 related to Protein SQS1 [Zygosaccharomyces bailii ISA1307]